MTNNTVQRQYPHAPLIGVCTAVWHETNILLIKRSKPPSQGLWAMPGGLVELGETLQEAAIRETYEETSIVLTAPLFNRTHEIIRHDDQGKVINHYILAMFAAQCQQTTIKAGDDAADARWFSMQEIRALEQSDQLLVHTKTFVEESISLLKIKA